MKIAQLVISPIIRVEIEPVDQLSLTDRGDNGFGSTGLAKI
jgi:dUTP pyrophosphatase